MIKLFFLYFLINQLTKIAFLQNFDGSTNQIRLFDEKGSISSSPSELSALYDYIDTENDEDTCLGDCKRLDFIVNFTDIGWEKWILYPRSFNAYHCSGSCSAPLAIQDNSILSTSSTPQKSDVQVTNHAQIMSIIEYNKNYDHKMTNCVPTKLKPLKVVYLNAEGEIDTREYENMIVGQCGCR